MMQWFVHQLISRVEQRVGQRLPYLRHIARVAPTTLIPLARLVAVSRFRRALPMRASHVARIVATRADDSSAGVQAALNLAARDAVAVDILQPLIDRRPEDLPGKLSDVYYLTEAIVGNTGDLSVRRQRFVQSFGEPALVEVALTIAAARAIPTVKQTLGYASSDRAMSLTVPITAHAPWEESRLDRAQHAGLPRLYSAPRRFDLATMFAVSLAYSMLLTGLRLLDAPTGLLAFAALLVTAVGLGQAVLFGGRYPRAASVIVGAVLAISSFLLFFSEYGPGSRLIFPLLIVGRLFDCLFFGLLGALLGYLSGALVGGVFLVAELMRRDRGSGDPSSPAAGTATR